MQKRPTPPGGFNNSGNEFTYLRQGIEGHRMGGYGSSRDPMMHDEYANAVDFDDIFNPESDNDGDE